MGERWRQLKWVDGILGLGLILMMIGIGMNIREKLVPAKVELLKAGVTPTSVIQVDVKVTFDIEGEVVNPGVYRLAKGARISDALTAANGLGANADREWVEKNINRAELLTDGMKIFIPKIGEAQNFKTPTGQEQILGSRLININTATVEELDKLSGIGPALAQRIIDYREANNGFKNINEIKLVSGIGDKLFEKIKDQIGI